MKLALRNRAVRYFVLTLAVLALVSSLHAVSAQNTWTGLTNANWSVETNWSGGSVPISADDVVFATPVPGTGSVITLVAGSAANSLSIQDNYTLSGGDLVLADGGVRVNLGHVLVLDSRLSGTAGLTKTGGGSLRLTNTANDFTGVITIADGSLVITNPLQLGSDASAIDMAGGVLEIRNDGSLNFGKNVYFRENSTIYTGPAVGGSGINGATTFGTFRIQADRTATFNSRNGYGFTFGTWTQESSDNNTTVTNNLGGLLTFSGDAWNNSDGSNRTLTIGGNGNTLITGSINTSGAGTKTLTKTGAGSLTIVGVDTTLNGPVNINGGAVVITDFRSLNNNTGNINIGTSTTAGALIVGTAQPATGAGLTTSKVLNLAGTTGTPSIYANQAGGNPVVFNSNFTATGAGVKTLTLGGTNTADNVINGVIPNSGVTGATTTTAAFAAGVTTISLNSVAGLTVGDAVTGTGIVVGTTVSAINPVTRVITLSAATAGAGTSGQTISSANLVGPTALTKIGSGTWVLAGANTYTGTTMIANGTLKLKANAATSSVLPPTSALTFAGSNNYAGAIFEFVGQDGVNNVQNLGNLSTGTGANTIRLTPGTGGTASLTFTGQSTGSGGTVNFVGAGFIDNKITIPGGNGLVSRTNYWEGADYAYRQSNVLRAPVYGVDPTFVIAGAAVIAGNNLITGNIAGQATISATTLKFDGSHTLSIAAGNTLTLSGAAVLATGGAATITGGAALHTSSNSLIIRVNQMTDTLTIGSVITGTSLTKNGAGTLILEAANEQIGTTTLNEGTTRLSGIGRLGAENGDLTIRQHAVLDLNGVTPSTNTRSFNNNGIVTNTSSDAVTFTIGGTNGTGTSYGIIDEVAGVINLAKTGTGAQSWFGTSTYTGVTTIGGTGLVTVDTLAAIGQASGIGRGDATDDATNAASLVFNGSTGGLIYTGSLREGNLTLGSQSASTDRLFTLAGTGATLSSTATNNNAIVWSNTGAIVHSGQAARTLTLTGTSTGDNTFNPQWTDSTGFVSSLTKTAAGQWNLGNANNTYTGQTTINEGILALNHNGALPTNSALVLSPTSATSAAIIQMSGVFNRNLSATPTAGTGTITWAGTTASTTGGAGFAAHATELIVAIGGVDSPTALTWGTGGFVGTSSVQNLVLNSTTALSSVDFRNAIDLGSAQRTVNVLDNTNTGADFAIMSGVLSGTGGSLRKIGTGALKLTGANTYTGATSVDQGVLRLSAVQNMAGALQFGSSSSTTTAGTLEVRENATFGSMTVQTDSSANTNTLVVDPGKTLTINGNVTIGTGRAASTNTLFTATGGGNMVVDNTAASGVFAVGGTTSASSQGNRAVADFSGLNSLTVNLSGATSSFRVNPTNSANVANKYSILLLPSTGDGDTTITANVLAVGDSSQYNGGDGHVNQMQLGTGDTVLNVNTVNIGTGTRDFGSVTFQDATGTLTVRAADGAGAAAFNLGTGSANTGAISYTNVNRFDVAGHNANLKLAAVAIGTQIRGDTLTNVFSFDTGTLEMASLIMSTRSGNTTNGPSNPRDTISTVNIGGGTASILNGVTAMATAAGTYGTNAAPKMIATINISGGAVSIGATGGNSMSMGNYTATGGTGAANATLNLTGGTTTLAGNIVKGGTSSLINAAVNLADGSLDMTGTSIGASGAGEITFNAQSGTLANLKELNGGGTLTKTTAGTLVMSGTNEYTGATWVNDGTLLVNGAHTGGGAYTVAGGTLGGTGSIGSLVNVNAGGRLAPGASIGTLAIVGNLTLDDDSTFEWEYDSLAADLLNLDGDLNLVGGVSLDLAGPASAVPYGTTYTLISYSGAWNDGIFEGYDNNSRFFAGLNEWQIRYDADASGINGGAYGSFVTLTVIPEPTSVVLFLGAMLCLLFGRRRRG